MVVFVNCTLWLIFIFKYVFSTSSSRCQVRVRSVPRSLYILYLNCHDHRKIFGPIKLHITTETKTGTHNLISQLSHIIKAWGKHVRSWSFLLSLYIAVVAENDKWYIITNHEKTVILIVDVSVMSEKDQDLTCFPQAFMIWDNWLIKLCVPKSNYT
jgi:hypothetical protein